MRLQPAAAQNGTQNVEIFLQLYLFGLHVRAPIVQRHGHVVMHVGKRIKILRNGCGKRFSFRSGTVYDGGACPFHQRWIGTPQKLQRFAQILAGKIHHFIRRAFNGVPPEIHAEIILHAAHIDVAHAIVTVR